MFASNGWAEKYDAAAQAFLGDDERVLAAVQVGRTGGFATLALSAVSGAAGLFSMMRAKQRGGGLPQMWLLAVTERRIYALALPKSSSGLKPRVVGELARWERDAVTVDVAPAAMGVTFTIHSPGEQERVACQGPAGALGDRVAAVLATAPAIAAEAA